MNIFMVCKMHIFVFSPLKILPNLKIMVAVLLQYTFNINVLIISRLFTLFESFI